MAIKITLGNKVRFAVEGSFTDEDGKDQPFKYELLCKRCDAAEHRKKTKGDIDFAQYMVDVTENWFSVNDADGAPLPFNEANLRQLLNQPGQAALAYFTYLRESGAKQKN